MKTNIVTSCEQTNPRVFIKQRKMLHISFPLTRFSMQFSLNNHHPHKLVHMWACICGYIWFLATHRERERERALPQNWRLKTNKKKIKKSQHEWRCTLQPYQQNSNKYDKDSWLDQIYKLFVHIRQKRQSFAHFLQVEHAKLLRKEASCAVPWA